MQSVLGDGEERVTGERGGCPAYTLNSACWAGVSEETDLGAVAGEGDYGE